MSQVPHGYRRQLIGCRLGANFPDFFLLLKMWYKFLICFLFLQQLAISARVFLISLSHWWRFCRKLSKHKFSDVESLVSSQGGSWGWGLRQVLCRGDKKAKTGPNWAALVCRAGSAVAEGARLELRACYGKLRGHDRPLQLQLPPLPICLSFQRLKMPQELFWSFCV